MLRGHPDPSLQVLKKLKTATNERGHPQGGNSDRRSDDNTIAAVSGVTKREKGPPGWQPRVGYRCGQLLGRD